jgi:hypothetical protein
LKFGMRCETCHNTRSWSLWNFDHSRQSSFRLDGAHQRVLCESCHKAPAPRNRNTATVGATCTSCHQSDDVHDGQFGRNCEQCHSTENWKKISDRVSRLNSSESVAVLPQSHRASRSTP